MGLEQQWGAGEGLAGSGSAGWTGRDSAPVKIWRVTTDTNYGGVQEVVLAICRNASPGFQHFVLNHEQNVTPKREERSVPRAEGRSRIEAEGFRRPLLQSRYVRNDPVNLVDPDGRNQRYIQAYYTNCDNDCDIDFMDWALGRVTAIKRDHFPESRTMLFGVHPGPDTLERVPRRTRAQAEPALDWNG